MPIQLNALLSLLSNSVLSLINHVMISISKHFRAISGCNHVNNRMINCTIKWYPMAAFIVYVNLKKTSWNYHKLQSKFQSTFSIWSWKIHLPWISFHLVINTYTISLIKMSNSKGGRNQFLAAVTCKTRFSAFFSRNKIINIFNFSWKKNLR